MVVISTRSLCGESESSLISLRQCGTNVRAVPSSPASDNINRLSINDHGMALDSISA